MGVKRRDLLGIKLCCLWVFVLLFVRVFWSLVFSSLVVLFSYRAILGTTSREKDYKNWFMMFPFFCSTVWQRPVQTVRTPGDCFQHRITWQCGITLTWQRRFCFFEKFLVPTWRNMKRRLHGDLIAAFQKLKGSYKKDGRRTLYSGR